MTNPKRTELFRAIKYVLIAASAGLIQISSFTLLTELTEFIYEVNYFIALVLSILWNFTFNRKYTFRSANNVPIAMTKAFAFYLVFTPLTLWGGAYFVHTLKWDEYIVTLICMLLNFVLEFLYQRFYVFKDSLDTNKLAKQKAE